MRDLDRSKVYDIEPLNEEQRIAVYDWLVENDKNWSELTIHGFVKLTNVFLLYNGIEWGWIREHKTNKNQVIANALELFEEEEDNPNMSISWPNIEVKYVKI